MLSIEGPCCRGSAAVRGADGNAAFKGPRPQTRIPVECVRGTHSPATGALLLPGEKARLLMSIVVRMYDNMTTPARA